MRRWLVSALFLALCSLAAAQMHPSRNRVDWRCDLGLQYYFDNREYDASEPYLLPSGTTHAAVLTPTLSAQWRPSRRVRHSLTLGADLQHDMGAGTWAGTFREGILYYDARVRGENGVFEGVAAFIPVR